MFDLENKTVTKNISRIFCVIRFIHIMSLYLSILQTVHRFKTEGFYRIWYFEIVQESVIQFIIYYIIIVVSCNIREYVHRTISFSTHFLY